MSDHDTMQISIKYDSLDFMKISLITEMNDQFKIIFLVARQGSDWLGHQNFSDPYFFHDSDLIMTMTLYLI